MLSKAQSLLGGNGASNPLGGLLGGLTGGNSKDQSTGSGSGASSVLSGVTDFFGKKTEGAKGGLGELAGKLFSHDKESQWAHVDMRSISYLNIVFLFLDNFYK